MDIKPEQFLDRYGRRVLTDEGIPGVDAKEGMGSTTEVMKGAVAAAIYANCPRLNNAQLDEIISWVQLYKTTL
ncbi:hypothetical protein HA052_19515 [Chromobacterium haemolyticum]|uniref:Uncharacterized protein n=1 Tax=Chromobacterium fluminis TaxID=3044269 RepID=A0ABX0LJK4_9NEIS|nr:hypothetical protein [Chromobacterium haemolyticum]NHR07382.1 hypothetical protein [Chromobacterium haemolyticum]